MPQKIDFQMIRNYRQKIHPIAGLLIMLSLIIGVFLFMNIRPAQVIDNSIKIGRAAQQEITGDVNVTGVLDSNGKTSIASQVSGLVAQVMVQEGSNVQQGDILASLDKRDLQEQLNQAQINVQKARYAADQAKIAYDQTQNDYARSQQLFQAGVISQSDFEQITQKRDLSKSQYDTAFNTGVPAAEIALNQARLALNKTDLISPLDGTVATCSINPGDYINANTSGPVITIVSHDKITLAGNVDEDTVNWLKLGQKADVFIDSLPGTVMTGEIDYLGAESIPTGQLFPVKIRLLNPDHQVKPGMTASAKIHIDLSSPVTVPKSAVFRRDGQTCVFVIKDKKAVSVVQGLNTGEQIIMDGTGAVINGMILPDSLFEK